MKNIGIIAAMEEENQAVVDIMEELETKNVYNLEFTLGKILDKKCVLVKSGVGKVNAARTTQIMIDSFNLDCVINVGSAGAINSMLDIGDVIIGKHVVQHDFDITAFNHVKGHIPGVGDKIYCDKDLLEKMSTTLKNTQERQYKIKSGVIASGDIFCTDIAMKDKIYSKFNADMVDMECAAIGQVAYLDKIPFVVIRSVSDKPNGNNAVAFDENLKLASKRCAEILKEFLY